MGLLTSDSRKSLSPVRIRSTPAFCAARKMGRSFTSLIFNSSDDVSTGVGIISIVVEIMAKN